MKLWVLNFFVLSGSYIWKAFLIFTLHYGASDAGRWNGMNKCAEKILSRSGFGSCVILRFRLNDFSRALLSYLVWRERWLRRLLLLFCFGRLVVAFLLHCYCLYTFFVGKIGTGCMLSVGKVTLYFWGFLYQIDIGRFWALLRYGSWISETFNIGVA